MQICGFIKNSFVDYPKHISSVIFTNGCNFNCWYCHNYYLIDGKYDKTISEEEILKFLNERQGMIDALVISGGEPTLQKDLVSFIKKVRALNYKIKLDTNGTNPEILEYLIDNNLIDFVAMDIKTSLNNYEQTINSKVDINKIKNSIKIIMKKAIDYEFRTTFAPGITVSDIKDIALVIKDAKQYVIQKYIPVKNREITFIPHNNETFNEALETAKKHVKNTILRSF